ncbi:hypothetical protein halTADL_1415 [Halohasta litchfieldiae]|jgi:hypothetical protein|uniref:Uncharacterized protein n=1 Tax=Halohasta litchfieldiae TaxID=1073996 RepID=A0A1H6W1J3_9EURY|nr:hypothetical protein [Halohasta litchfieldiae]ATW88189.1 hypothetical protein halTADL_1415 [Halohasta litchfieldiae]SEJ09716.1 hypothetical protein SAMN05444271_1211 [Halohasta litchfieldiae]
MDSKDSLGLLAVIILYFLGYLTVGGPAIESVTGFETLSATGTYGVGRLWELVSKPQGWIFCFGSVLPYFTYIHLRARLAGESVEAYWESSSNQREDRPSDGNSLARLGFALRVISTIAIVVLFIGVGILPTEWGLSVGVGISVFIVYMMFREEIEQRLTGPQEWLLFALVGTLFVIALLIEGVELNNEILLLYTVLLGVSAVFGYRALKR